MVEGNQQWGQIQETAAGLTDFQGATQFGLTAAEDTLNLIYLAL